MAITTYDDLAYLNPNPIEEPCDLTLIASGGLRAAAAKYLADGHRDATALQAGNYGEPGPEVLYLPRQRRAAVVWNGDPTWTVAESADDALERFFGVGGKQMTL